MSETTAILRRKIRSAGDLRSVVRTMDALAAKINARIPWGTGDAGY